MLSKQSLVYLKSWFDCVQDHVERGDLGLTAIAVVVVVVAMDQVLALQPDLDAINFHEWLNDIMRQQCERHVDKPLQELGLRVQRLHCTVDVYENSYRHRTSPHGDTDRQQYMILAIS